MNKMYILILFLFFSSSTRSQDINFKTTVIRLQDNIDETMHKGVEDGWYGVMNIPDLLFMAIIDDKDVYHIFSHPLQFKERLLTYINDDSIKWEYKYFALGLLQGMCIQEYLPVAENIYNLFDRKISSAPVDVSKPIRANNFHPSLDVLKLSIEQGGLSMEICKNYNSASIKKILKKIISNEKIPIEIKNYCREVLSGNIYKQKKMNLEKHLITIPIFECKKGKPYFHSRGFYLGN